MKKTAVFLALACAGALIRPVHAAGLGTVEVASGLTDPIYATSAPGDNTDLYIVERTGTIMDLNTQTHALSTFLTIPGVNSSSEEGLLGLAFDPNYATNGDFYVNVSLGTGNGNQNIVEYHATSSSAANTSSLGTLFSWNNPLSQIHKAGWIGFAPPGTRTNDANDLYIFTGDGSPYPQLNDVANNAQSLTSYLGKIMRIHVDPSNPSAYSIPANNPFAGSPDPTINQAIFAYGVRNPFRASFDLTTGDLYFGDVGQDTREEIDVQKASNPGGGNNYEWRYREGNIGTPLPTSSEISAGAPAGGVGGPLTGAANETGPILDYAHTTAIDGLPNLIGSCVIGGYVYRGTAIQGLDGTYIFADLLGPSGNSSTFYSLNYNSTTGAVSNLQDLTSQLNTHTLRGVVSFGEDNAGDLFIVDQGSSADAAPPGGGTIWEIVETPEPASAFLLLAGGLGLLRRRSRRTS